MEGDSIRGGDGRVAVSVTVPLDSRDRLREAPVCCLVPQLVCEPAALVKGQEQVKNNSNRQAL